MQRDNEQLLEIKSWDYFASKTQENEKNTHVFRQRETDLFHVGADLHRSSKGENLERERDDRKHAKPAMSHKPGCFKALSSAEAPLRKVSAGVKFRGWRRREPLPEATPNMAAIRGSHFVTRVVCVLMS